jgi:iron complex transport system ATP-binding protein
MISSDPMEQLELRGVSARYASGGEDVVRDVSWKARRGRVLAIVGPNGCGKSTLLRVACGLLPPRLGQVLAGERDVLAMSPRQRARLVALLPQHFEVAQELSVREVVALGRTPHLGDYGALGARDEEVIDSVLAKVEATQWANRPLRELSGGQRQRVMMARALAQEAPFLLLDEPISHLDLRYQFEILKLARELSRGVTSAPASTCGGQESGHGVVVVLHHINLAASVADDMLLLGRGGHVLASGEPAEVVTREHLEEAFEVPLSVSPHPLSRRPQAQSGWSFDAQL